MDLDIQLIEEKWKKNWADSGLYSFPIKSSGELFSIDGPPPTVSGTMHMGHAFSYPHQDFVARYKRMRGYRVLYPWGLDDNGLATERYVEKITGKKGSAESISEFNAECYRISTELEKELSETARSLGLSVDFERAYRTISREVQAISQKAFLVLVRKGSAYRKKAPSYKCPLCGTAISQSELKNKTKETDFVDIEFKGEAGSITISTTRPELLFACVALAVNPQDDRYSHLIGKKFRVPIAGYEVSVIGEQSVDTGKGTGAEMICTFGDQNDLEIWKRLELPLRVIVDDSGRMNAEALFLLGKKINEAKREIVERLDKEGYLKGSRKITHTVNAHERCDTPVEIAISTQWFVKSLELKEELIDRGREIKWKPDFMRIRYENWVNGLKWDWCISRQRFYGVPFPVWYCRKCGGIVLAEEKDLPVDPRTDSPREKCHSCGSEDLEPETDVLDTWATSSLTPDILYQKYDLGKTDYPLSCRFQGHDIISTWGFTTILRAHLKHSSIPWKEISISGNVNDPEGKKLSKSKGNSFSPVELIKKYGADAIRYWSASISPWEDVSISDQELVRGRRLAIKIFNVGKLLGMLSSGRNVKVSANSTAPYDRWVVSLLKNTWQEVTSAMDEFNFYRARLALDNFYWNSFCDNYLEILKSESRAGNDPEGKSLDTAHFVFLNILRMYAPFVPFITEEVHDILNIPGKKNSIHSDRWPNLSGISNDDSGFDTTIKAISKIRSARSAMKIPPAASVKKVTLKGDMNILERDSAILSRLLKVDKLEISDQKGELVAEIDS